MGKIFVISFIALSLFAFIGALLVGTVLHEYSHMQDFNEHATKQEVCMLNLPTEINWKSLWNLNAYYGMEYSIDDEQEIQRIDKYTESKAYIVTSVVMLIFIIFLTIVVVHLRNQNDNIEFLLTDIRALEEDYYNY